MWCSSSPTLLTCRLRLLIIALTALTIARFAPAQARQIVPAPEPSHPEAAIRPADEALPGSLPSEFSGLLGPESFLLQEQEAQAAFGLFAGDKGLGRDGKRYDDIGGDDVQVAEAEYMRNSDIAIASDGTIFAAVDGGTQFSLWGTLSDPDSQEGYREPAILACEGADDRLFVAFTRVTASGDNRIGMVYAPLWDETATFSTEITVMEQAGVEFAIPRLASDAVSYDTYYLYLVAVGRVYPGGFDIWFARCTNRGASFATPYMIGSLSSNDRNYYAPDVCYGYGGWVHVTWRFYHINHDFDGALRYRRAPSFASGGDGSWEPMVALTTTTNGVDEWQSRIAASPDSPEVVIGYTRREWIGGSSYGGLPPGFMGSTDQGATFATQVVMDEGNDFMLDAEYQQSTGNFIAMGEMYAAPYFRRANKADLGSWSAAQTLADTSYGTGTYPGKGIGMDPTRGDRLATAWSDGMSGESPHHFYFDAEWHADPGYPNLEEGFPLALANTPISPPALVDLDGNGDLETVFSDNGHHIQVIRIDGTSLPGWPVDVGTSLSDGPVAIGDMRGDGQLSVLVGTTDGRVFGYDQTGTALAGFPYDMPEAAPTYVSIGALGGPYPRMGVATSDCWIHAFNFRGVCYGNVCISGTTYSSPAAFGDVDSDGVNEILAASDYYLTARQFWSSSAKYNVILPGAASDAPTLGDIDLDGECEIMVPCNSGYMCMFDGDGIMHPGWPVRTESETPLTSAAIAQILQSYEPDLVWAARNWTVEGYYHTGSPMPGWPRSTTTSWFLYGAPVLDSINDSTGDVLIGDRGMQAWGFTNIGRLIPGWPKDAGARIQLSPAVGDIDLDGNAEVVFLTLESMIVVDVHNPPNSAHFRWPMYGHDPQRTGCHNCPEDVTTAVSDDPGGGPAITRVALRVPSPTPTTGPTMFTFEIPVRSQARLDIYDLRGRRVRTVWREEVDPGVHACEWNGRDERDRRLSSGVYFAQLQVRGPGLNQTVSRKISLLR
jgi:hypothetical protein